MGAAEPAVVPGALQDRAVMLSGLFWSDVQVAGHLKGLVEYAACDGGLFCHCQGSSVMEEQNY